MTRRVPHNQGNEFVIVYIVLTLVTVVFLATTWGQEVDIVNCLPNDTICERINCAPPAECINGIIVEKGSRCRCCPVCVTLLGDGAKCPQEEEPENGPIHSKMCKNGFLCVGGFCVKNDTLMSECLIKRGKRENGKLNFPAVLPAHHQLWLPECDEDGRFKIKQCQHGRCFCVDRDTGERIFGQEEADLAQNMTCACSYALHQRRQRLKAEKIDAEWQTYEQEHCTTSGDYEHLQCYKDTCFCVHPQTGEPHGTMVKMKQRDLLPCYEPKLNKESYLSRCEKQLITERRILYDFAQKEITIRGLVEIDCDPDGSFIRRLCKPEICYCSDREGTSFGVYKKDRLDGVSDLEMQCRCARDEEDIIHNHARYERLKCDSFGNFAVFQCFDTECFCVDENGDRLTEVVDIKEKGIKSIRDECLRVLMLLGEPVPNNSSAYYIMDDSFNENFEESLVNI